MKSRYCKDCIHYHEEPDEQDGVTERICQRDGWQTSPFLTCPWQETEDKYAKGVSENTDRIYQDVAEELRYGN